MTSTLLIILPKSQAKKFPDPKRVKCGINRATGNNTESTASDNTPSKLQKHFENISAQILCRHGDTAECLYRGGHVACTPCIRWQQVVSMLRRHSWLLVSCILCASVWWLDSVEHIRLRHAIRTATCNIFISFINIHHTQSQKSKNLDTKNTKISSKP